MKRYTREELERMGIDDLNRMAFGVVGGEERTLEPSSIRILYLGDLENPEALFAQQGMAWARGVDLSEPVEVSVNDVGIHDFRSLPSCPCFADVDVTDESGRERPHLVPANGRQYLGATALARSDRERFCHPVSPRWRRFSPLLRSRSWSAPHAEQTHCLTSQLNSPAGPVRAWQLLHLRVEFFSDTFSTTLPARWPIAVSLV